MTGVERYQPKTRAEWLALRRRDVTASQIAALIEEHPYTTPLQLWQEKTGRKVSDDDIIDDAMERGLELQEIAVKRLARKLPTAKLEFNDANEYWRDPALRIGCTPDVLASDPTRGKGVVELKAIEPSIYKHTWPDGVPPFYVKAQVITQAHLVGAEWAAIGVLRVGFKVEFDLIDVPLRIEEWRALQNAASLFWQDVDSDIAPLPDFARDGAVIAELAGPSDGTHLDLSMDNELIDALYRREEHKKLMGMLDDELEAIDAMIRFKAGPPRNPDRWRFPADAQDRTSEAIRRGSANAATDQNEAHPKRRTEPTSMSKIITFPNPDDPMINPEILAIAQHLLIRVQAGVTVGLAVVEHQLGDDVVIEVCGAGSDHQLNSGSARLAHLLAGMKGSEL